MRAVTDVNRLSGFKGCATWAGDLDPVTLGRLGARILHHIAPDIAEQRETDVIARQQARAYRKRAFTMSPIDAGLTRLTGWLDATGAATVNAALDPLCHPRRDDPSGPRSAPPKPDAWPATHKILPAILGGDSQVLDLGRARRLFTGPIRRALILRDHGCALPNCDQPARRGGGHDTNIGPTPAGRGRGTWFSSAVSAWNRYRVS